MSKQINKKKFEYKTSKLLRIDSGFHRMLKILAAEKNKSVKELVEEAISDYWEFEFAPKVNANS